MQQTGESSLTWAAVGTPHPYSAYAERATDGKLPSEDWQLIFEVVDRVEELSTAYCL
jgi:hypothetical protein